MDSTPKLFPEGHPIVEASIEAFEGKFRQLAAAGCRSRANGNVAWSECSWNWIQLLMKFSQPHAESRELMA